MRYGKVWMWSALVLLGACSGSDDPGGRGNGAGGASGFNGVGGASGAGGISGASGAGGVSGASGAGGISGAGGTGGVGPLPFVQLNECPGTLQQAQVDALMAPGATTVAPMRWLYPYDGTVMPRGLSGPSLQWDESSAGASQAVLLKLKSQAFEYVGCLVPSAAGRVQIPQAVWESAGAQSKGRGDPLTVDLIALSGSTVSALPTRTLFFALATLKSAVYYNTYNSPLANGMGIASGVVMRVLPNQAQPEVFLTAGNTLTNCVGCHAVSANGSRIVAEEHVQPGLAEAASLIWDISNIGTMTRPAPLLSNLVRAGFSGLYPDGSVYLTTGRPQLGPLGGTGNVTGTFGPEDTRLIDATTGADIAGHGAPKYALMPSFSTDGQVVAFNHLADAGTGGQTLAMMDYDSASRTFSALRPVYTAPGGKFAGWPFFMPEVHSDAQENVVVPGRRMVFALGDKNDYFTQDAPIGLVPHSSELWWLDVDSGQAARLARANGFDGANNYMPYGARDANRDFLPTVSPVAAGGYFWMFFTSRRNYGNEHVIAAELAAETKKIWVAAIDANATPGTDPSHPAFFLPGQEHSSGNIRAFAALEPCRVDGEDCTSGVDCCSGFCIDGKCGTPDVPRCSGVDEKCETSADCCEEDRTVCIGGFCGYPVPE